MAFNGDKKKTMTRILILGGTRYLGKAIASRIAKENFETATMSRSDTPTTQKHFVCDRKDTSELKRVLVHFNPHIILDMVNYDQGDSAKICDLYRQGWCESLIHYIMISSFLVYNHFDYGAYAEMKLSNNFDQEKIDGYTRRKIESEVTLYNSKLMAISTILRLPFVFSSDDSTNRFQNLCELALNDDNLNHDLSAGYQLKYSLLRKDDAAESIIKVINSDPIGIADLSNHGCVTSSELLEIIKISLRQRKLNKKSKILDFPYFVDKEIYLRSKKLRIELSLLDALKVEAQSYSLTRN